MRRFILRVVCPGVFAFPESSPKKTHFYWNFWKYLNIIKHNEWALGEPQRKEKSGRWRSIVGGMKENLMFFGLRSPKFRLEGFCLVPAMRGKHQGKLLECEKNFPVLWMTSEKKFSIWLPTFPHFTGMCTIQLERFPPAELSPCWSADSDLPSYQCAMGHAGNVGLFFIFIFSMTRGFVSFSRT